MNAEWKAIKACADYARLSADIRCLTRAISDSLSGCLGVNGHLKLPANWMLDGDAMARQEDDKTHLALAYRGDVVETYPEPYLRHYSAQNWSNSFRYARIVWRPTVRFRPAKQLASHSVRPSGLSR